MNTLNGNTVDPAPGRWTQGPGNVRDGLGPAQHCLAAGWMRW